jgi:hypothetical protein
MRNWTFAAVGNDDTGEIARARRGVRVLRE